MVVEKDAVCGLSVVCPIYADKKLNLQNNFPVLWVQLRSVLQKENFFCLIAGDKEFFHKDYCLKRMAELSEVKCFAKGLICGSIIH